MYGKRLWIWVLPAALVLACATGPASALKIQPNYGTFSVEDVEVLKAAVKEWSDRLPCTDGKTIPITFSCDTSQTIPGLADVLFDANGDVERATVTLDNDALRFSLIEPGDWEAKYWHLIDALTVAKHEIGHAIGFLHEPTSKFMKKVKVINGNRFYDMNSNGVYDAGIDFDLSDVVNWQGHAADEKYVMFAAFGTQERIHESRAEAAVLADAYGYCLAPVPEPGSLLALAGGLVSLAGMALRRRR